MKLLIPLFLSLISWLPGSTPEKPQKHGGHSGIFSPEDRPAHLVGYSAITLKRGFILSEAFVNGQKGIFIIDTGAPYLVLNSNQIISDTSTPIQEGASNTTAIRETAVKHFQWAGIERKNIEALSLDISHLEDVLRLPIAGLIGFNVIKNHELVIDYELSLVQLFKSKKSNHLDAIEIPFSLDEHLPVIEATIGDNKLKLGLDTGSEVNLLDENWSTENNLLFHESGHHEVRGLDKKIKKARVATINITTIAGQDIDAMNYLLTPLSRKCQKFNIKIDGLLGHPFFRKGKFAINYKKEKTLFLS